MFMPLTLFSSCLNVAQRLHLCIMLMQYSKCCLDIVINTIFNTISSFGKWWILQKQLSRLMLTVFVYKFSLKTASLTHHTWCRFISRTFCDELKSLLGIFIHTTSAMAMALTSSWPTPLWGSTIWEHGRCSYTLMDGSTCSLAHARW